jgi:hypothetical protein
MCTVIVLVAFSLVLGGVAKVLSYQDEHAKVQYTSSQCRDIFIDGDPRHNGYECSKAGMP